MASFTWCSKYTWCLPTWQHCYPHLSLEWLYLWLHSDEHKNHDQHYRESGCLFVKLVYAASQASFPSTQRYIFSLKLFYGAFRFLVSARFCACLAKIFQCSVTEPSLPPAKKKKKSFKTILKTLLRNTHSLLEFLFQQNSCFPSKKFFLDWLRCSGSR